MTDLPPSTPGAQATEPYDVNFCFPVRELENDRVKVTPCIPSIHLEAFWEETKDHPELYTYLPFGPIPDFAALTAMWETRFQQDPQWVVYVVLDKSQPDQPLAGLVGFLNAAPHNLSVEIGMLMCLPKFQRKGMTYAGVALLMQYALLLPREGGLGLRRVQWQTHMANKGSQQLAQKLGFRIEGVLRWQRALGAGKLGNGVPEREGDPLPGMKGRDSMMLAVCWDDWEREVKTKICVPEYTMYAA